MEFAAYDARIESTKHGVPEKTQRQNLIDGEKPKSNTDPKSWETSDEVEIKRPACLRGHRLTYTDWARIEIRTKAWPIELSKLLESYREKNGRSKLPFGNLRLHMKNWRHQRCQERACRLTVPALIVEKKEPQQQSQSAVKTNCDLCKDGIRPDGVYCACRAGEMRREIDGYEATGRARTAAAAVSQVPR
jgi:hypothetical protein